MNRLKNYIEQILDDATSHGEDSYEPDHEVGDLQDLCRAMWLLLTPAQRLSLIARRDRATGQILPEQQQ